MKVEIENLLKTIGIQGYQYVNNIDDSSEGFYYNPRPEILVRVMYTINNNNVYDSYLIIDRFNILTYNQSVSYKKILSGMVLLTDGGEFNSDFYTKILSNLNLF